jgi:hydroxymethylbilane synthase
MEVKMRKKILRIGSRDSVLAVRQTRIVIGAIRRLRPDIEVELVTMTTFGDLNLQPFEELNAQRRERQSKAFFTKELEQALLDGRIDLAVHSLKDMPMIMDFDPLPILAFFERDDPRDALVPPLGRAETGGDIGCSSARRRAQLRELLPGRPVRPIRGNVLTRLKKLDDGNEYSSLILAAAGLRRLGLESRASRIFEPEEMIPAPGQGTLICQGISGGDYRFLEGINDLDSETCSRAERAFAERLSGGCALPVAAYAEVHGTELRLMGFYADEARKIYRKGSLSGGREDAVKLGETLAGRLLREGE